MTRNNERVSELQFQADSEYLNSLTPMEKERLNETRRATATRSFVGITAISQKYSCYSYAA